MNAATSCESSRRLSKVGVGVVRAKYANVPARRTTKRSSRNSPGARDTESRRPSCSCSPCTVARSARRLRMVMRRRVPEGTRIRGPGTVAGRPTSAKPDTSTSRVLGAFGRHVIRRTSSASEYSPSCSLPAISRWLLLVRSATSGPALRAPMVARTTSGARSSVFARDRGRGGVMRRSVSRRAPNVMKVGSRRRSSVVLLLERRDGRHNEKGSAAGPSDEYAAGVCSEQGRGRATWPRAPTSVRRRSRSRPGPNPGGRGESSG